MLVELSQVWPQTLVGPTEQEVVEGISLEFGKQVFRTSEAGREFYNMAPCGDIRQILLGVPPDRCKIGVGFSVMEVQGQVSSEQ